MTDAAATVTDAPGENDLGPPALVVRDVHVIYEIHEDAQRPTLRRLMARRFQPRPARKVHAVRGVTFTAHEGEAVALIGRNGSGKSTLLRAIGGLQNTAGGKVFARSNPVLLGVGAALHPELSGRRNVFLGGTALGIPKDELEQRFDEIVEFAGVSEFIDLPLRAFSSGMSARLQFAVASSVTPDILLIDEALAVGDEEFRAKSRHRIERLLEQAGCVFLVSHSMEAVKEVCSRGIWLDKGEVVLDGPIEQVVERYVHFARTGEKPPPPDVDEPRGPADAS